MEIVLPALRLIGDVHGKYGGYICLAHEAKCSIQLGDMGFNYRRIADELDPVRHRILGGNHDNYEENAAGKFYFQPDHFLGDFGVHSVAGYDFFYVRGGNSIDKEYRKEGLDWWPREQITYRQATEALALYDSIRPDYVITHECPAGVIDFVSGGKTWNGRYIQPSMTANLLQQMFDSHKPKFWYFGHHHKDWEADLLGCKFQCLNELSYVDLPEKENNGL